MLADRTGRPLCNYTISICCRQAYLPNRTQQNLANSGKMLFESEESNLTDRDKRNDKMRFPPTLNHRPHFPPHSPARGKQLSLRAHDCLSSLSLCESLTGEKNMLCMHPCLFFLLLMYVQAYTHVHKHTHGEISLLSSHAPVDTNPSNWLASPSKYSDYKTGGECQTTTKYLPECLPMIPSDCCCLFFFSSRTCRNAECEH